MMHLIDIFLEEATPENVHHSIHYNCIEIEKS